MKLCRRVFKLLIVMLCLYLCFVDGGRVPEEYDFAEIREGYNKYLFTGTADGIQQKIYDELTSAFGTVSTEHVMGDKVVYGYRVDWPDDVGSVSVCNGYIVMGLTDLTRDTVAKYKRMVTESEYLRFVKVRFSENELYETEWRIYYDAGNIHNSGVGPYYNVRGGGVGNGEKDEYIKVFVSPASYDAAVKYFWENYGDIVKVAADEAIPEDPNDPMYLDPFYK